MTINKSDFIRQLIDDGYTKKDATMVVDDFWNLVERNLLAGNSISFYGYGSFDVHYRERRECKKFNTCERIEIAGHYVPKFTAGSKLKKAVRAWENTGHRDGDADA